jgi:Family of unknown function (DUF5318)
VPARNLVVYALQRRAALADLRAGRRSALDVCDAHPHLKLAARHYGQPSQSPCPVCQSVKLCEVHYVYGESLRTASGQAKLPAELTMLAERHDQFAVYVVEVCVDCGWNHLIRSFMLGTGGSSSADTAAAGGV